MSDTKKIGARIVLDGESEFRSSIASSKNALKQFDSELKLTAAQFKNNEKSMEALEKTQSTYVKKQAELQKQEKAYSEQLEKASKAHATAVEAHNKTAKSVETLKKKLDEAKKVYGEDSEEVKKLSKELNDAETSYTKQGKAITDLENKMTKWETSLNETRTDLVNVNDSLKTINSSIENYGNEMDDVADSTSKANPQIQTFGTNLGTLVKADLVATGIKALASAMTSLATSSISVGMEFESSMSNVKAISGATGDEITTLTNKAREMGAATIYSASQAADAFSYMALAGWNTEQMLEGISPILSLAAASSMDLASASDIVTDYLTAFGLEASDAAHFSDVMAKAMSTSNTTVTLLGESYKNCAATAASMNIEMEDVTAVLATMANQGIKGSEAGTALSTILTRIATNASEATDKLKGYGVDVYDTVTKQMNSLPKILSDLADVWKTLGDEEKAALAKTVAGTNHYSKFITIMNGVSQSAKDAGQSFDDYAEAFRNCDGAAQDMADTMQDNLKGKVSILKSSMDALKESIYDVFDEDLKDGVDIATSAITRLNTAVKSGNLNVSLQKLSTNLNTLIDKAASWLEKNLPTIVDHFANLVGNADKIVPLIASMVTGLLAFKAASTGVALVTAAMQLYKTATEAATTAQLAANAAANANPYILLGTAIIAAGTALATYLSLQGETTVTLQAADASTRALVETISASNSTISESIAKRKTDIDSLDTQAETARTLAERVLELSEKDTLLASEQIELKNSVDQLNSAYPSLNLQLDENGRLTEASTAAIKENMEAVIKQTKVSAAKEKLTEIAKEQLTAEQNLADAEEEVAEKLDAFHEKKAAYEEAQKQYTSGLWGEATALNAQGEALDNARQEMKDATSDLAAAQTAYKQTEQTVSDLTEQYEYFYGIAYDSSGAISESADGITTVGNSAETTAGQLYVLSDSFQETLTTMSSSVASALDLSSSLFNKAEDVATASVSDMESAVDSHITQITEWGESYEKLAGKVDDSTGLVLQYFANLGTEGKGYIDALLTLEDDELKEFTDKMVTALQLPSTTAEKISSSYSDAVKTAIDNAVTVVEDAAADGSEYSKAVQEVADAATEAADEMKEAVIETTEATVSAMANGFAEGTEEVANSAVDLSKTTDKSIGDILNETTGRGYADAVVDGIVDGINSRLPEIQAAGESIGNALDNASRSRLQINSPSKVFRKIGNYVGEGLELGIKDSIPKAVKTLNDTLPNEKNVEVGNMFKVNDSSSSNMNNLATMLSQYLPQLANTNVNISLEGDAKGIFRVVRQENTRIIKSTGYRPLTQ